MQWIVFAALIAVMVAGLMPALLGGERAGRRDATALDVLRAQLAELESEISRGVLTEDEGAAARIELQRRVLAEDPGADRHTGTSSFSAGTRRAVAATAAVVLPAGAIWLYLALGSPGLPGQPLAARDEITAAVTESAGGGNMAQLVERLAARLEEQPGDARGWELLGRSYGQLGRFREAVAAFDRALALDPENLVLLETRAESLVRVAQGMVTPAAEAAFRDALKKDQKSFVASYYLALAAFQAGHYRRAYDDWLRLGRGAEPGAPWLAAVQEGLDQAAVRLGIEAAALAVSAPEPLAVGPDAGEIEAAAEMSAGDRQAFIRSMVARLAARLEDQPDDVEGWLRLARSYQVLGEAGEARRVLQKLLDSLPEGDNRLGAVRDRLKALESEDGT